MDQTVLETLQTSFPSILHSVVQQDRQSPTFEILDWNVRHLSSQGIRSPDGLFLYSGSGRDANGTRPWSVVLKLIENQDRWNEPVDSLWYWKREALFLESGIVSELPGPIAAPRYYGIEEGPEGVRIWMEFVTDTSPARWTQAEFVHAAYELGRFNAAYLTGSAQPDFPWMVKKHAAGWVSAIPPQDAWENPFVREAFSADLRERIHRLWDERELYYDWLSRMPQVFSHFDYQRRNLMMRTADDGSRQVVALDWALCGHGPVGGDLGMLIGMSANLGELEPASLPDVGRAAEDAYWEGLNAAGWQGNREWVHLTYLSWMALFAGVTAPALTAIWTNESRRDALKRQLGVTPAEGAARWAAIAAHALERADEARALARRIFQAPRLV